MSKELVQRLHNIWRDDDHKRGCGGRSYDCTCGFDDRSFETAREAADLIERQSKIIEEMREALMPFGRMDHVSIQVVEGGYFVGCDYASQPRLEDFTRARTLTNTGER